MSEGKKRSRGGLAIISPPKRRSQRKSTSDSPIPEPIMKRSITVKKIMPRKTLAAIVNTGSQSTPKVSNVPPAPRRSSRISPKIQKENAFSEQSQIVHKDVPGQSSAPKINVLSPIPVNIQLSPKQDNRDIIMSQKVRRSYSRLEMSLNSSSSLYSPTRKTDSSDTSTPNVVLKSGRSSLFGFDKLLNSEMPDGELKKSNGVTRKKNTKERILGTVLPEQPDHNIPGVVLAKQKRRKRKVAIIEKSDLDEWAAFMNAEFEEAEKFDLTVE
ncbi:sororin [Xenopus laevis]|uniref:Sororin n=2 Tax=Xenopus laevis TaxID=8355 RepID=CCA5A_XENLA|nr:sororin [Xenopus laevis]Q563C3.1 RecName: Full=Sororin; AltName: Full=Cell division cycle-associated protein 5-A; AltName: Full=Xp35 [Xenopus laevis]AAI69583.1 Sororin [Xenopus laevis]AAI69585.1 Sororin [Xenopus laevis]AAX73201.1 sororin [Xenopus laevis]